MTFNEFQTDGNILNVLKGEHITLYVPIYEWTYNMLFWCVLLKGGTNTSYGLKFVRENSFQPQHGARTNASKILIVITDGQSADSVSTKHEAQLLHNQGIKVYAVGVGSDVSQII